MASRGSSLAARLAGKTPVKKPTIAEKVAMKRRKSMGKAKTETAVPPNLDATKLSIVFSPKPIPTPMTIPLIPPKKPTIIASDKNRILMSEGEAPIVLMIPISLVLSRRVTVIVLNIPMAETVSATPPKAARTICTT